MQEGYSPPCVVYRVDMISCLLCRQHKNYIERTKPMKEIIKECQVCGAKYKGCNFCEQQNQFLAWRSVVCKPEHFAYHIPIISYIRKQISKEQAKEDLINAEKMYGEIEYAENIKDVVNDIKGVVLENPEVEVIEEQPKKKTTKRTRKSKVDS